MIRPRTIVPCRAVEYDKDNMSRECPNCDERVPDDAGQCIHCGTYIVGDERRVSNKASWLILIAFVAVIVVMRLLNQ